MKIAITSESTIDLTPSLLKEYEIRTTPFTVLMGEKEYKDGEITSSDLFAYTKEHKKLPHTAAINQFQYEEFFNEVLNEGYDHIIHFATSSAISSACSNATEVAEKMKGKVSVIDTLSLSTGMALQAIYAQNLVRSGYSVDEVVEKVLERRKGAKASFTLETLDNLYKGGRCSALSLLGANLLRLKPKIIVQENGAMTKGHVYKGPLAKVNASYVDDTLKENPNLDRSLAFITHSGIAPEVVEIVRKKLVEAGFRRIEETRAGATISVYCGPNTLGILFYADGEHPVLAK